MDILLMVIGQWSVVPEKVFQANLLAIG